MDSFQIPTETTKTALFFNDSALNCKVGRDQLLAQNTRFKWGTLNTGQDHDSSCSGCEQDLARRAYACDGKRCCCRPTN